MTRKSTVTRLKREAATFDVPQTQQEVADAIAAIGIAQRHRDRIQAAMNDELAALRKQYEEQAKPFADEIKARASGVQLWCEAHRDEITNGGKRKSCSMSSGEVKWRMRPPSVAVRGVEAVIDALKSLGLTRFLRVKEEVNREAILADPEAAAAVRGITVSQREDFVIVPHETDLEEVQ